MNIKAIALTLLSSVLLTGCLSDYIPSPKDKEDKRIKEAVAVGSACRQAGKSIEECFEQNETLPREGIFQGWKEMEEYMRENKLPVQPKGVSVYGAGREKEPDAASTDATATPVPAAADTASSAPIKAQDTLGAKKSGQTESKPAATTQTANPASASPSGANQVPPGTANAATSSKDKDAAAAKK